MPTMTLTYRKFPSGEVLEKIGTFMVPKKTKEGPLPAPNPFEHRKNTYVFQFWVAVASPSFDSDLTFTTPDDNSSFAVDAWYLEKGGNGPPPPVVTTYAFKLNPPHGVFPDTPIASVTDGSGAWSGPPSTTVNTNTSKNPVKIFALDKITGYGLYNSWFQSCSKGTTVDNKKRLLEVPSNGYGFAIAFYGIPVPDPCQGAREAYENYVPDPGTPPNVVHAERLTLWGKLNACEVTNGESLTPKPA